MLTTIHRHVRGPKVIPIFTLILLPAALGWFVAAAQNLPRPGSLDLTFGNAGIVTSPFMTAVNSANSVAIQPDGKIIVAGSIYEPQYDRSSIAVYRHNPNGTPDVSFGQGGRVITSLAYSYILRVAIQTDGKIVLAGSAPGGYAAPNDFLVVRYNPNGTLDTSFNGNGISTVNIPRGNSPFTSDLATGLAIQPDGKIAIAGMSGHCSDDFCEYIDDQIFAAARLLPDGSLDTSFGSSGTVSTSVSSGDRVNDLAIQPDGKLVLVGYSNSGNLLAIRYNTNGSLDTTFDGDGKLVSAIPDTYGNAVSLQSDGKIAIAGRVVQAGASKFGVFRYNNDGSPDTSFGNGGMAATSIGTNDAGNAVAIQPDGKLVIAGVSYRTTNQDFAVVRYRADGSLDTYYGTAGKVVVDVTNQLNDYGAAVALDSEGKAVVAGSVDDWRAFGVIRLIGGEGPGKPLFDFDGDGRTDLSVFRPTEGNWYLNRSTAGFLTLKWGVAGDLLVPGDFDGDGRTDTAVFRPAADSSPNFYIIKSSDYTFTFSHWGESDDIPLAGDFDGDGKADLTVFRPSNNTWYFNNSSGLSSTTFGDSGDRPVPGDYDGDGTTDIARFRPSTGEWIIRDINGQVATIGWGIPGDVPVAADYDGDDKDDRAIYRPSEGNWYIHGSSAGMYTVQWGIASDIPVPGDYDGDGKADQAVYRDGTWWLLRSTAGMSTQQFGMANDEPIPAAYLP